MTWKELRDKISRMTEEEQQQEVAIWGEDFPLRAEGCLFMKADKAVYCNDDWGDESYEEDELTEEDLMDTGTRKLCDKGLWYIFG